MQLADGYFASVRWSGVQLGGNYEFTLQALKELTYLLATVSLL
jgi:hypothetical protein